MTSKDGIEDCASKLWTVPLPSQTQLDLAPLSTYMWTPRMHIQTLSTAAIDYPQA